MRCVSVKQPWATLLVFGHTHYLVRSWRTFHRGPLAIHASASLPAPHVELCCHPAMEQWLRRCGYNYAMELPRKAVLGLVTITDCLRVTEENLAQFEGVEPAFFFGKLQPGRWAWKATSAKHFAKPIPMGGRLGTFQVDNDRLMSSIQLISADCDILVS